MDLDAILKYSMAVVSVLLIVFVLLQDRGSGLGNVFGGTSGGGEFYRSKRGLESVFFNGTIILAILFSIIAVAIAVVNA